MSKIIKNRVPISEKNKAISTQDVFFNEMQLDPQLEAELKSKNLGYRFINATQFRKTGFHRAKWVPYKRETKGSIDSVFGTDPEGYTRRGDLILAVKPMSDVERHRALLNQKAKALTGNQVQRRQAQEFRELAAESGVKSHISEGYEDSSEGQE